MKTLIPLALIEGWGISIIWNFWGHTFFVCVGVAIMLGGIAGLGRERQEQEALDLAALRHKQLIDAVKK